MELLDTVNDRDELIGVTNKIEAHEKGYAHRVAAVYVFTPDKKLLVQLRKKDGLLDHSVGGHVKQGESYFEAAQRELKEELGITAALTEIGVFYADERVATRKLQVVHYFGLYEIRVSAEEMNHIITAEDEVEKLIPMKLEDVTADMMTHPERYTTGFIATLNYYIKTHSLPIASIPLR